MTHPEFCCGSRHNARHNPDHAAADEGGPEEEEEDDEDQDRFWRRSAADLDQNPRCFSGLSERATHSAFFLYFPSFHFFTL
jgi:hypothetical protein